MAGTGGGSWLIFSDSNLHSRTGKSWQRLRPDTVSVGRLARAATSPCPDFLVATGGDDFKWLKQLCVDIFQAIDQATRTNHGLTGYVLGLWVEQGRVARGVSVAGVLIS